MKMMSGKVAAMAALLLAHHVAWAAEVDEAREALQTTDEDVTQEKNLEEVFQAAEKPEGEARAKKRGAEKRGDDDGR